MREVTDMSAQATAKRLHTLADLIEQGQASETTSRALDKLLAYEKEVAHSQLAELRSDLGRFEREYGMSSDEFFRRFQSGQTDDRMDYVEWASLIQMALNLERRLELLTSAPAE
jgi:hypothetical protein